MPLRGAAEGRQPGKQALFSATRIQTRREAHKLAADWPIHKHSLICIVFVSLLSVSPVPLAINTAVMSHAAIPPDTSLLWASLRCSSSLFVVPYSFFYHPL